MAHDPSRQMYRGPVGWLAQPFVSALRGHGLPYRYRLIWKAHRAMWRLTRSNLVYIHRHVLEVDPGDSLALAKGRYEPDESNFYRAHVKPGEYVVEAGANVGVFTCLLARLVGPEGEIDTFEPDPDLRRILEGNLERNGYRNVRVHAAAVADEPGELTFFRNPANQGDNRLFTHDDQDGATFPVRAVALDDALADRRRIDLLKMDIQGAEVLALRGLRKTLAERPPRTIMMEFWPYGIDGMGGNPREMIEELVGYGYTVTELRTGNPLDLDKALEEMTVENQQWVNLLLRHEDAASE